MSYRGKFYPKNISKYRGDVNNIIFRSLWEYHAFRWCDLNPDVSKWGSEETIIPYRCSTDGQMHRYFVDLTIEFSNGKKLLVEIKPEHQTKPPEKKKGKTQEKLITESLTYMKNESKWLEAQKYAKKNGFIFQVWTEKTLESIGIITNISKYPRKNK